MNPPLLDPKYIRLIDIYTKCHRVVNELPPCQLGGSAFKIVTSLINQPLLEGEQPWELRACYVFYLGVVLSNVLNLGIELDKLVSPLDNMIPAGACNQDIYKVFIERSLLGLYDAFDSSNMTELKRILKGILGLLTIHCQADIAMHFNTIHSERMNRVYRVL